MSFIKAYSKNICRLVLLAYSTIAHAGYMLMAVGSMMVVLNSPVAEVRRVFTATDGTVIYLGEVTYRGDFIRIDMDLRP